MSLVPISEFGRALGLKTTVIDSLINIANTIFRKDYRKDGRNLTRLGLNGLDLEQIREIMIKGKK
jgi:opine dehydrogenase